MITQQTLRAERPASEFLDVLLAEDNEVNQKLAVRLLEKRGHNVTVVSNGRQAVQAARSHTFDLILMDVQMPEMDGIEATAAIRKREGGTGQHQAIVAMTALVMKGDRERCLDAKMDGYLSKPVRPQELDELLEIFSARKRISLPGEPRSSTVSEATIDLPDLMARVDGDLIFVAELIEVLREDCPRKFNALRAAVEESDASGVKHTAHGLKGALGNLSAKRAASLAARLELLGATNELTGAPDLLRELETESTKAIESLSAICGEQVL